ncbi:hypothetical protein C8Q80DRAFT_271627 [Daedaleopsis nitida]|nr:hypothetical protein C8Q80DRAFT_271627 [Daedaleopsis nitida]
MTSLPTYEGKKRQLVVAIDLGTTFSGVSYAILNPGEVSRIDTVKRYHGMEKDAQHYRIPSVLKYRVDGTVHSCGAVAESGETRMLLEYDDLMTAKWFKLHLRPHNLTSTEIELPALPAGKTAVQVFADFLRYLWQCTGEYIQQIGPQERQMWDSLRDDTVFVLSHPNGWEAAQQSMMRDAAVLAGLVSDSPAGHERIHFVTEGEAGLHYCLHKLAGCVKSGQGLMVVDAGGGTVDISSYLCKSTLPMCFEEICSPDCMVQGSTVVNMRAERFIRERFRNEHEVDEEAIQTAVESFDKEAKPLFSSSREGDSYINTGLRRLTKADLNVRRGNLLLTRDEMESFFRPSFEAIIGAIRRQFQSTKGGYVSNVFLIGGFSANDWLHENLKGSLETMGLDLYRPENDERASKAVADGAILYYLEHYVSHRIVKTTIGTPVNRQFNPLDLRHRARMQKASINRTGLTFEDGFSVLVEKGTRIKDNQEFSEQFCMTYHPAKELSTITDEIIEYTGDEKDPQWMEEEPGSFKRLCLVRADLSNVEGETRPGVIGDVHYKKFKIILRFGVEPTAQIGWVENGEEKRWAVWRRGMCSCADEFAGELHGSSSATRTIDFSHHSFSVGTESVSHTTMIVDVHAGGASHERHLAVHRSYRISSM